MKKLHSSAEAFNVIIVGAWNPAIFTPEWAKENLADNKSDEVILAISMPPTNLSNRLTVDEVNIYPSANLLMLDCVEYTPKGIESCARKIEKIAQLLPHTPVSAVGFNFRYSGELTDSTDLSELFTFSDSAKIDGRKFSLSGALIKRSFVIATSTVLNFSMDTLGSDLRVEFNYHSDVRALKDVLEKTTGAVMETARNESLNFLNEVYGISIE